MNHGSLFSGIGGFDLAAEWMGWNNIFSCEINPFGRKVLQHYWPNTKHYEDINKTDFTIHRGGIDILTGGFPCQPFSLAGKRKGTEDDRHLWPRMLEVIREVQPSWVVGENVYGLINWDRGLVFDQIQIDLENEGYEVQPVILSAVSVNAPHRRDRIWFVAYSDNARTGNELRTNGKRTKENEGREGFSQSEFRENGRDVTDTESGSSKGKHEQRQGKGKFGGRNSEVITDTNSRRQPSEEHRQEKPGRVTKESLPNNWQNFPTQSPICSGDDGLSRRLDGITFPKWRNESIKAYGNAIVPQEIYQIFKAIQEYEDN